MSRWFRFYDCALDDPKVQRLSDALFKTWVNLLCVASRNGGRLPAVEDLAFMLRLSEEEMAARLDKLTDARLLDEGDTGMSPHNWDERQFKSDVSSERVKRFRQRSTKRETDVSETPPDTDTDTDTETDTEKKEEPFPAETGGQPPSDAFAVPAVVPGYEAIDAKAALWSEGLPALIRLGVSEKQSRPVIGGWLKSNSPEVVLDAIRRATRECPFAPVPWITAALRPPQRAGPSRFKPSITDTILDLLAEERAQ